MRRQRPNERVPQHDVADSYHVEMVAESATIGQAERLREVLSRVSATSPPPPTGPSFRARSRAARGGRR